MLKFSRESFIANAIEHFLKLNQTLKMRLFLLIATCLLGDTPALAWDECQLSHVKIMYSVVFSRFDNVNLKCDIFLPCRDTRKSKLLPAVILVHGGAWSIGSRSQLGGLAMHLAKNGLIAMTVDYRLAPKWKHPSQIDDIRSALAWICIRQQCYGIDINRLGLFGYSAGGHLACLIGTLADETLATQSLVSDWPVDDVRWLNMIQPNAVCVGGAPCDLASVANRTGQLSFFLNEKDENSLTGHCFASPNNYTSETDVSTLLIHGLSDWVVPAETSLNFHKHQVISGTDSIFVGLPNRGHIVTFFDIRTTNNILNFFESKLALQFSKE